MREIERGRKMGRNKERQNMRASSIDFISAFPLLNRQDIFQKQSRQLALYPPMLYLYCYYYINYCHVLLQLCYVTIDLSISLQPFVL